MISLQIFFSVEPGDDHACIALCWNAPPWRWQLRQVGGVPFSQGVATSHLQNIALAYLQDVGKLKSHENSCVGKPPKNTGFYHFEQSKCCFKNAKTSILQIPKKYPFFGPPLDAAVDEKDGDNKNLFSRHFAHDVDVGRLDAQAEVNKSDDNNKIDLDADFVPDND